MSPCVGPLKFRIFFRLAQIIGYFSIIYGSLVIETIVSGKQNLIEVVLNISLGSYWYKGCA
jgi:hypothetical protein